jgi:signal transduction histidine kinase
VAQAVAEAELVEGRSSVRVKTSLPGHPCVAEVDSGWLSLALGELISQAIRCARRHVEVSVKAEDGGIVIGVEDDRTAVMEVPSTRFVSVADRRDAALGWPLVCDVAKAHGAVLASEVLHSETATVKGLRLTLQLGGG